MVGKELVILLLDCVVGKCFVIYFPSHLHGVYLNWDF